jgi:predicted type IV restriction endonuclease
VHSVKPKLREMPANKYEANFRVAIGFQKWFHQHCGWPDYLVVRDGKVSLIEIKGPEDHLQHDQIVMFDILTAMGLEVLICKDGDPEKLITVDQYIYQQGLIRTVKDEVLSLQPLKQAAKGFIDNKLKVYHDHSWVYRYLGVKDARSTDHPK